MSDKKPLMRKAVFSLVFLLLLATSGWSFYSSRNLAEAVVLSPGVTKVARLSDYFGGIRGTVNDANVYFFEGEEPGATMFVMGGTHPEEPAGRLASWLFAENLVMEQGRMIVVLSANRSATTVTRIGGAYPPDFTIPTDWGQQTFRHGDRWSNPLDQFREIRVSSTRSVILATLRSTSTPRAGRSWPTSTSATSTAPGPDAPTAASRSALTSPTWR